MKLYNLLPCTLATALLFTACFNQEEEDIVITTGTSSSYNVIIDVDFSTPINQDLIGFGWNVHPNNIPTGNATYLEAWDQFFLEAGNSWIRMITQSFCWEKDNDDDDPLTHPDDWSGFRWCEGQEGMGDGFYHLLDLCEANDIEVEVNHWNINESGMNTLDDGLAWMDHRRDESGNPIEANVLESAAEFGEHLGAFIYWLKTEANNGKGYDCVKYYAVWNEPAGMEGDDFISFDHPGYHNLLINNVKKQIEYYDSLMGTDVMSQMQGVGLEGGTTWRNSKYSASSTWNEMIGLGVLTYQEDPSGVNGELLYDWPDADDAVDFISIHDYNSVMDYDVNRSGNQGGIGERLIDLRVTAAVNLINQYGTDGVGNERVLINELGSHSVCNVNTTAPMYDHMFYSVEGFLRAVNAGISGGSIWALNQHVFYNGIVYPGVWYDTGSSAVEVSEENYYPYQLFCKSIRRGSVVYDLTLAGGADNTKSTESYDIVYTSRVWASAVETDGKKKIIVVNDSYNTKYLTINVEGMGTTITREEINSGDYLNGTQTETISARSSSEIVDNISARSITVYTQE